MLPHLSPVPLVEFLVAKFACRFTWHASIASLRSHQTCFHRASMRHILTSSVPPTFWLCTRARVYACRSIRAKRISTRMTEAVTTRRTTIILPWRSTGSKATLVASGITIGTTSTVTLVPVSMMVLGWLSTTTRVLRWEGSSALAEQ